MKLIKQLLLAFLLFSISPVCMGQSRPIHFNISGISIGQETSKEEIKRAFHDYEISDYGNKLCLLFNKAYKYSYEGVPISRIDFTLNNGLVVNIKCRTYSTGSIGLDQFDTISDRIQSQYGIFDEGEGSLIGNERKWNGANGVSLTVSKEYEGAIVNVYIDVHCSTQQSLKSLSLFEKINDTAL